MKGPFTLGPYDVGPGKFTPELLKYYFQNDQAALIAGLDLS